MLFNLIGTPLMAKLSDRTGRRTIYVLDVALFAAGSLVVAFSPNFAVLLIGRAMQGLGAGGIFPVASAVIGDTFPPRTRRHARPDRRGVRAGLPDRPDPGRRAARTLRLAVALPDQPADRRDRHHLGPGDAALDPARGTPPLRLDRHDGAGVLLASLAFGIDQFDTTNFVSSLLSPNVWARSC